jgi:hypothetical protein
MLFRDPRVSPQPLNRFRPDTIPFTFGPDGDGFVARVVTNAETTVELMHDLSDYLGPAVTVTVRDRRHRETWQSEGIALPDAREGVSRMRVALGQFGGVDVVLDAGDESVTLTAHLELELLARTDRWFYVLTGLGLVEARDVPPKRWTRTDRDWMPEPDLQVAVEHAVSRMGLDAI